MAGLTLQAKPLTADAFAPFGLVVDIDDGGLESDIINQGHTLKFADLLPLDCAEAGGRVSVHVYRSKGRRLPLEVKVLERHPLGSQAFWPLSRRPYLIVVAPPGPPPGAPDVCAFVARGDQAIQYHRGTWHHYQISLEADSDYLVLDRAGPGDNCDEARLAEPLTITL